jgi:ADP-ribose pyrophosphatase
VIYDPCATCAHRTDFRGLAFSKKSRAFLERSAPVTDAVSRRRVIYRGSKIELALEPFRRADGTDAERELVVHRGAVALVPVVDDGHVCLVENERYAVGKTLLEVPAGTIDRGESPEVTAGRELVEETGYRAGRITRIHEWYVSPGYLTEKMYLFLCEDLVPGPLNLEPDERLRPVVVRWEDAMAMAADGRIEDAKTIAALLVCDRLRKKEGAAR